MRGGSQENDIMVYRIYTEKKEIAAGASRSLLSDINNLLGITSVKNLKILNRYDAEGIEKSLFDYAVKTVFSEPQTDIAYETPDLSGATVFAVIPYFPHSRAMSLVIAIRPAFEAEYAT